MPRLVGMQRRVWVPGIYRRGFNPPSDNPIPIPADATMITILAERDNWPILPGGVPENEILKFIVEISLDEGVTWGEVMTLPHPEIENARVVTPTYMDASFPGGVRIDLAGNEVTHAILGPHLLPDPPNEDRVARITMEVRAQLRTQLDIDIT